MNRDEGSALKTRYDRCWRKRHEAPAMRLLVEMPPVANDADWHPLGAA